MEGVIMGKFVKIIIALMSFLYGGQTLKANDAEEEDYPKYVHEIVREFAREVYKKYGLYCESSGGSMPHDVEEISIDFTVRKRATIEEARKLEVELIESFLKKVNAHEKIRPFLREYPFTPRRAGITIAFTKQNGCWSHDGSVVYVNTGKGNLYYNKAEVVKEIRYGIIDCRDLNNTIKHPDREVEVERLFTIHSEPYEEALRIVKGEGSKK